MFQLNPVRAENFAASGPNWQGTNGDFPGVLWVTVQAIDNTAVMAGRVQGRVVSRYNRSPTNKDHNGKAFMPHLQDDTKPTGGKLRFGVFEADPRSGELLKYGVRIPLQRRPFEALLFLLQHANAVVTREELQKHLWSSDVFVDFDHGLNTAIRKVRRALNDDAGEPRYIETVGRLGYRFLLPVEIQQTELEAKSA